MLTKKKFYLFVLFGASFILLLNKISGEFSSLLSHLFSFIGIGNIESIIYVVVKLGCYLASAVACYLILPSMHKNDSLMKMMIIIFTLVYLILSSFGLIVGMISSLFSGRFLHDIAKFLRIGAPTIMLCGLILILTFRVFSMKDDSNKPPRIR